MAAVVDDNGVASNGDPADKDNEDTRIAYNPTELSEAEDRHDETGSDDPSDLGSNTGNDTEDEDEDIAKGEDDEDDEDDEDEPVLKYERIGEEIPNLLRKDSAASISIGKDIMALGTHAGFVHILDHNGKRSKTYRPHHASVLELCLDSTADFVASASMDGKVAIIALNSTESYSFDMKRPMRTVSLEPGFGSKGSRAFVCGGMAGDLVLHEKGWLGHKETVLDRGEGPVWQARWQDRFIAWASDAGVKVYDYVSQSRLIYIDRAADSPRADLFRCTLQWEDSHTLLVAWAELIKIVRIRDRPRIPTNGTTVHQSPFVAEITAVFQLDCMVSGLIPLSHSLDSGNSSLSGPSTLLVLTFAPPDNSFLDERPQDRSRQARKQAERPELRLLSRSGEELSADCISVSGYTSWGCNDYNIASLPTPGRWVVLSPKDLVLVSARDRKDHLSWLLERTRYEEALQTLEEMEARGETKAFGPEFDVSAIGQKYIEYLVGEGNYVKAAELCPKVCAHDAKRWEEWIFVFAEKQQLQAMIPFVPMDSPRLDHLVYEMILGHFLSHDKPILLKTIKEWPKEIYDVSAVIVAVHSELNRVTKSRNVSTMKPPDNVILMECLAELYTINRQPGKALTYFLRLRKPNVFDLIRDNNLFTDVRDQVFLLVEFDQELVEKRKQAGESVPDGQSEAISLLVDNTHSIPIARVVQQLQSRPRYLFYYLDALAGKDPSLVADFADVQVKLYAEYATLQLIDFLRASTDYNLEAAYNVCQERDLVLEMVFLLGHMGNNKKALTLIIERLGDVNRAIEFAKEQADDDLWEDLLRYSETRPAFIRGLLENVGPEINPIRLIRRIKNGLEIPGLKEALIKILQDFQLQISLLEGCQTILAGDSSQLTRKLQKDQTGGFFLTAKALCPVCTCPLQENPQGLLLLFLCRHIVHASCAIPSDALPSLPDPALRAMENATRGLGGKIAFESMIRVQIRQGCPVCQRRSEGARRSEFQVQQALVTQR